jgi:hypothetical protein
MPISFDLARFNVAAQQIVGPERREKKRMKKEKFHPSSFIL